MNYRISQWNLFCELIRFSSKQLLPFTALQYFGVFFEKLYGRIMINLIYETSIPKASWGHDRNCLVNSALLGIFDWEAFTKSANHWQFHKRNWELGHNVLQEMVQSLKFLLGLQFRSPLHKWYWPWLIV